MNVHEVSLNGLKLLESVLTTKNCLRHRRETSTLYCVPCSTVILTKRVKIASTTVLDDFLDF